MRALAFALVGVIAACGGGTSPSTPDAAIDGAATTDGAIDAPPNGACELAVTLGTVVPAQVLAQFTGGGGGGGGPSSYSIDNQLTNDPTYDVISLELYKGHGAFTAGFPTTFPVTIQLTGAELNYATCGVCVRAFGDVANNQWAGEYFATGGSVTLTALSKTRMTGKLVGVTLTHVMKNSVTTIHINDGCTSTLGELDFDAVPTMAFTGILPVTVLRRLAD